MKYPVRFLIGSLAFPLLMGLYGIAYAQDTPQIKAKDVELSAPIGQNVLPGGNLSAENIQTSVIFSKIIPFAIKYAIRLAIAAAVIALIIGGWQYLTAYGDAEKHTTATKTILYALIGLVLSITAYGIVAIITSIQLT